MLLLLPLATIRSNFRLLFMSAINTLPGPFATEIGEPGALTNNDFCVAVEEAFPELQETRKNIENATNMKPKANERLLVRDSNSPTLDRMMFTPRLIDLGILPREG